MRSIGAAMVFEVTAAVPDRRKSSPKERRTFSIFLGASQLARDGMVDLKWRSVD